MGESGCCRGAREARCARAGALVGAACAAPRRRRRVGARRAATAPCRSSRTTRAAPSCACRAGPRRPVACASETGYATSESTIAVTSSGALIYSPAESENSMARSLNGGASWSLTYPAEEQPTSFWNTVDPDVVADRRTGRVFWSHATGPVRNEGELPAGSRLLSRRGATASRSTARAMTARTFTTADYQTAPTGDWEKVFVGPPPPAAAAPPQPVGYPDVVYLCANSPAGGAGPGRLCYKSLDGGVTFSIAGYTSPTREQPGRRLPAAELQHRRGRQPGDDLSAGRLRTLRLRRRQPRRGRERDLDPASPTLRPARR